MATILELNKVRAQQTDAIKDKYGLTQESVHITNDNSEPNNTTDTPSNISMATILELSEQMTQQLDAIRAKYGITQEILHIPNDNSEPNNTTDTPSDISMATILELSEQFNQRLNAIRAKYCITQEIVHIPNDTSEPINTTDTPSGNEPAPLVAPFDNGLNWYGHKWMGDIIIVGGCFVVVSVAYKCLLGRTKTSSELAVKMEDILVKNLVSDTKDLLAKTAVNLLVETVDSCIGAEQTAELIPSLKTPSAKITTELSLQRPEPDMDPSPSEGIYGDSIITPPDDFTLKNEYDIVSPIYNTWDLVDAPATNQF